VEKNEEEQRGCQSEKKEKQIVREREEKG